MLRHHDQIDVFIGLDVEKGTHHAVALDRRGASVLDRAMPNDEARLRTMLTDLMRQGTVLLVVDQPATVGALPVAVAQAMGIAVGYLPGLTMRRMADTLPGEAKTDARDALVIATTARTAPHTLRSLAIADEDIASLGLLCGFDADVIGQQTAATNRLRGLLLQIHPALERVLGPNLERAGVLELLQRYPTPAAMRAGGPRRMETFLRRHGSRKAELLAPAITRALGEQTVVVAGTATAAAILPRLAAQLLLLRDQRTEVAAEVETLVRLHPLCPVLISLPGIGVGTAAKILVTTAGKIFPSAAHLAGYAGIAPVTRRSGTSVRGEYASRRGNTVLKDALFFAAFASLSHPPSRVYYDRKKAEDKTHLQAVMALARRRTDVLYAMLRDGAPYRAPA